MAVDERIRARGLEVKTSPKIRAGSYRRLYSEDQKRGGYSPGADGLTNR
jgi:hypothetical protein